MINPDDSRLESWRGRWPAQLCFGGAVDQPLGAQAARHRLPPQRQLASELGINVSTVSRAYKELQLRGRVIGSKRRVKTVLAGKTIKRVVFVPKRLINYVVG